MVLKIPLVDSLDSLEILLIDEFVVDGLGTLLDLLEYEIEEEIIAENLFVLHSDVLLQQLQKAEEKELQKLVILLPVLDVGVEKREEKELLFLDSQLLVS